MDNHTNDTQSVDTATDTTNSTYTQPGPTYTDSSTKDADTAYTDSTTKVTDTTVLDTTIPSEKTNFTDAADSSDGQGILHKFQHDAEFRHRFMHTAFVWWGFVTLGWLVALSGTAFPDIRLIINKDLETASWLFTAGALGYMVGAFVGGLIFDRVNRLLMLSLVIIIMGVTDAAKPWCANFAVMMAVNTVGSIASGGLDVGGNSHIASICGAEAGPFMHSIHFGFSIGGILSPLTAEPFLARKNCKPENPGQNMTNVTMSTTMRITTTTECEEYGETRVYWAYAIGGALMLSAAIPFLVLYCKSGTYSRNTKKEVEMAKLADESNVNGNLPVLSLKLKIVFIFFLSMLLANYCGVESRFSSLLMTFVVEYLDWTKSAGAHVNTVFWATFSAGRFLGILVTRFLKPKTMLLIYLILLTATFSGFIVASIYNITWLIWTLTAVSGLAMSIIFPSIFTWTAESILPVTGTVSGIYLLTVSVFNMLAPLLYGHLMDHYTQLWFTYLLAGQCVLCLVLFWAIVVLVKKYITPNRKPFKVQADF